MSSITFQADKVKVAGPQQDGSYSVTFYTGEYEQKNIVDVVAIPQNTMITVTVEVENG